MNNKLRELMELSDAVDVICKSVDEEYAEKQERYKTTLSQLWNIMWDELDEFKTVVKSMHFNNGDRLGKYTFGYPYGYNALTGQDGLTFIIGQKNSVLVYCDFGGSWGPIHRWNFADVYRRHPDTVEALLGNWRKCMNVYEQIEKDLEKQFSERIKKKAMDHKKKLEEIDKKLMEQAE